MIKKQIFSVKVKIIEARGLQTEKGHDAEMANPYVVIETCGLTK